MRRLSACLMIAALLAALIAVPASAGGDIASYTVTTTCYFETGEIAWTRSVAVMTKEEVKQAVIDGKADCSPDSIWGEDKAKVDVEKNYSVIPI